jgi:hypothetical protein
MFDHKFIIKFAWIKIYQRYMKGFQTPEEMQDIWDKVYWNSIINPQYADSSYLRERILRVLGARKIFDLSADWPYLPDVSYVPTYCEICNMIEEGIIKENEKGVVTL